MAGQTDDHRPLDWVNWRWLAGGAGWAGCWIGTAGLARVQQEKVARLVVGWAQHFVQTFRGGISWKHFVEAFREGEIKQPEL